MQQRDASPLQLVGLVAAGGAAGSLARWGTALALPTPHDGLPLATLLVNVVGCLLLGLLVGRLPDSVRLRALLGTGVLGGFTTMSTFALQSVRLPPTLAVAYIVLSVAAGLAAARGGLALARR